MKKTVVAILIVVLAAVLLIAAVPYPTNATVEVRVVCNCYPNGAGTWGVYNVQFSNGVPVSLAGPVNLTNLSSKTGLLTRYAQIVSAFSKPALNYIGGRFSGD